MAKTTLKMLNSIFMNTTVKRWSVFVFLIPLLFLSASKPGSVRFHKGNLSSAKDLAAREGKLYLVDFVASWCMPCRWMEETTFSNPEVSRYLSEHYVSVKIDIDDFDGFAYKQIYDIKILPSILIFNSKGELLAQYQESLAPSKMLSILKKYNQANNRVAFASEAGQRPNETKANANDRVRPAPGAKPHQNNRPVMAPAKPPRPRPQTSKPTVAQAPAPIHRPASAPAKPAPSISKPSAYAQTAAPSSPATWSNEGLYRFRVARQASEGYSVQIGAFQEYGNVLREVAILEDRFNEPIIVNIAKRNGQAVYKVMVGEFTERQAADEFKQFLTKSGLTGLTKDLSTL